MKNTNFNVKTMMFVAIAGLMGFAPLRAEKTEKSVPRKIVEEVFDGACTTVQETINAVTCFAGCLPTVAEYAFDASWHAAKAVIGATRAVVPCALLSTVPYLLSTGVVKAAVAAETLLPAIAASAQSVGASAATVAGSTAQPIVLGTQLASLAMANPIVGALVVASLLYSGYNVFVK